MNPRYEPLPFGTNPLVQTGFVPGMNRGNGLREVYTNLAKQTKCIPAGFDIVMAMPEDEHMVTRCTGQ
jgi:hypothetical protein